MITIDSDGYRFNYRVAGIAVRDGAVLLHRSEEDAFWCLPGGRCEMGEDAASTLRREMIEEIGAEPIVGPLAWVVENFFEYGGMRSHELGMYFLMSFPDDSPVHKRGTTFIGDEAGKRLIYQWFDIASLAGVSVKPSFIGARVAALSDIVEHIVHTDRA